MEPLKKEIVQVKSSSCLAGSPNWIARPLLRQPSEERLRFLSSWFCLPEYQHIFQDISEYQHIFKDIPNISTYFRISWDLRQLSLSECVTHFLLRFWPSAQFAIAPKPFKVEVWKSWPSKSRYEKVWTSVWNPVKLQQVGEQQRYGGSLSVEPCNNYTWVLTAVAQGGKSRDVQGGRFWGLLKDSAHFFMFST